MRSWSGWSRLPTCWCRTSGRGQSIVWVLRLRGCGDYPALVITSISGYGAGGPYETRKAFDLLLGETGVIATTGNGDDLAKVGISVGDIGAAVYGTIGTLAAL